MIVKNTDFEEPRAYNNFLALGSFDGLHLGHLSLIKKLCQEAEKYNGKSILYTFANHPRALIDKNKAPELIIDNKEKEKLVKKLGIDTVYFQEFNEEFMQLSPEEFIVFLIEKFNVKGIVVGFNYRFGYKNLGNTELLKELAEKYKFKLYIMSPYTYKDEVISSTRIRKDIKSGNIEDADIMLSRPFFMQGRVVSGKRLGRTIGFPTANLEYNKKFILPGEGVYYTNVEVNGNIYKGITSIGNAPTVDGKKVTVETNILDFDKDIYGKEIKVYFIKKMRDNKKFDGIKQLEEQLKKDKESAYKENFLLHK